MPSTIAYPLLS